MALKQYKPNTPASAAGPRRPVGLWEGKPVKALTEGLNKSGGRNNKGRVRIPARRRT